VDCVALDEAVVGVSLGQTPEELVALVVYARLVRAQVRERLRVNAGVSAHAQHVCDPQIRAARVEGLVLPAGETELAVVVLDRGRLRKAHGVVEVVVSCPAHPGVHLLHDLLFAAPYALCGRRVQRMARLR